MMTTEKIAPGHASHGGWLLEAFLLTSMTLVAMALGVGLYLQFGFALWLAAVSALSTYVALVSAHVLIRRSETISVLNRELGLLEDELSKLRRLSGSRPKPGVEPGPSLSGLQPRRPGPSPVPSSLAMPDASRPAAPPGPPRQGTLPPAPTLSTTTPEAPPARGPSAPIMPAAPLRHGGNRLAEALGVGSAVSPPIPAHAAERIRAEVSALDDDMDAINGMIRRLAEEMNEAPEADMTLERGVLLRRQDSPGPGATPDASISASVDALRAAALRMRTGDATDPLPALVATPLVPKDTTASPGRLALPPPVGPAQARMTEIADAISAERFDVYLEPILGLSDRRAHHYEFSVRLKTKSGETVGPQEYASLARGTGMLPMLDAACVSRISTMAAYMVERGSPGAVLASISGESLSSNHLPEALAAAYRRGSTATERAILSVSQSAISGPEQWVALKRIGGFGLRMALENVTTFEMDFNALKSAGFAFLRVDAQMLLPNADDAKSGAGTSELIQRLAQSGLSLIVRQIENDRQLASLQACGVQLGQGPLFGGPRPVKAEAVRPAGGVAA